MNLNYLTKENKQELVWMGCYGIGLGRTMAAVVEQSHDDNGIIWPENIAPYKVIILIMATKDETQVKVANDLYDRLNALGVECILDDRDERPGVKFKDSELIGIPYRVNVGKKAAEGIVELKNRKTGEQVELTIDELIKKMI